MTDFDRSKLDELARSEDRGLDEAARQRILSTIHDKGGRTVVRARRVRQATHMAAFAAVAVLFVGVSRYVMVPQPPGLEGPETFAKAAECESWGLDRSGANAEFESHARGEVLEMSQRATIWAEEGTRTAVLANEPCKLIVALDHGRVVVHAKDLGGGELRVQTREGDVVVHGTIFAVESFSEAIEVDVAEGLVEVGAGDENETLVRPGERVRRSRKKNEKRKMSEEAVLEMLDRVRAPVAKAADTEQDEPSPVEEIPISETEVETEENTPLSPPKRVVRRRRRARPAPRVPSPTPKIPEPAEPVAPEVRDPVEAPSLGRLLAQAEKLRRAGDITGAREAFRKAGQYPDRDARNAWVGLARLELGQGRISATRAALREYHRRGGGVLEPEALWIGVRAEEKAGNTNEAKRLAEELVRDHEDTPQGEAAQRWLERED
jgi:hypothetical protein